MIILYIILGILALAILGFAWIGFWTICGPIIDTWKDRRYLDQHYKTAGLPPEEKKETGQN